MSVVYWRARAEQAEQKLKLCLRGIGLIGASAGLYNDANCPIPMVEVVARVVDEIDRLTRERDEARAKAERLGQWLADAGYCTDCGDEPECPACLDLASAWSGEHDCALCNPEFECPNPKCRYTAAQAREGE